MKLAYFLISLISCSVFNADIVKNLEPQMHKISNQMASVVIPIGDTKSLANYIFETFSKPSMVSFTEKIELPDINHKSLIERFSFAKDYSKKLESDYKNHLQKSLKSWLGAHTRTSIQKRQSTDITSHKKRKNTWGLLNHNNQGRYISSLLVNLLTLPLWMGMMSTGMGGFIALSLWQNLFFDSIWGRVTFGTW